MTPNFALILSFDGIELRHLTPDGAVPVGRADVAAADLTEMLGMLRAQAAKIAPDGVLCELVIPNDQIKYLSVEIADESHSDASSAASAALDGATPYNVEDLVYDVIESGQKTQIAAVAKETLQEAEDFAVQHGFNPVLFSAMPDANVFGKKPDFGFTKSAKAHKADPDSITSEAEEPTLSDVISALIEPNKPDDENNHLDTPAEAIDAQETDETTPVTAEFVSIRKVPTFRTERAPAHPQTKGVADRELPGFDDAPAKKRGTTAKKQKTRAASVEPDPAVNAQASIGAIVHNEAERLTVFGEREEKTTANTKSRTMIAGGLIAAGFVGAAIFIGGKAVDGIGAYFTSSDLTEAPSQFAAPLQPEFQAAAAKVETPAPEDVVTLASLDPALSDEDSAVLEALRDPIRSEPEEPAEPTADEMRASYAATGIWPTAPDVPSPPPLVDLDDMYVTSIDPINPNFDAVALPGLESYGRDVAFLTPRSPAPATTKFVLDDRGFVVPTPEGALNPDGIPVYAGPPPLRQPDNLLRIEEPGEDLATRLLLAGFRPNARPSDLAETTERATLSGLTREELGGLRPRLRPQSAQETARANASLVNLEGSGSDAALIQPQDENSFDGATARAVAASLRPDARPNNFSAIVARVQRQQPKPQPVAVAPTPRIIQPQIPSSASASREATVRNAINLRKVNLIGVYGTPSSRRALVRLGNGRYRKVEVGDRIDGGRVSAIGDSELRYQKSGRAIVLKMPKG